MSIKNIHCAFGDDVGIIENKWLVDLKNKYSDWEWLRLDASIDTIDSSSVVSELLSNNLFFKGRVVFIRNAELAEKEVNKVLESFSKVSTDDKVLILILKSLDKRTLLGKILNNQAMLREFKKPEIKPFEFIDSLSRKKVTVALNQSNLLFDNGSNIFIIYSLLCGHFSLLRRIKDLKISNFNQLAKSLGIHTFRAKKLLEVEGFWTKNDLNRTLEELSSLGKAIRSWQYDPIVLLHMFIISACLGETDE